MSQRAVEEEAFYFTLKLILLVTGHTGRLQFPSLTSRGGVRPAHNHLVHFRYHVGSLAFGALILTLVQIARMILEYIDHKTRGTRLIVAVLL